MNLMKPLTASSGKVVSEVAYSLVQFFIRFSLPKSGIKDFMKKQIMILCALFTIAVLSSAQGRFSIKGIADEELNNRCFVFIALVN